MSLLWMSPNAIALCDDAEVVKVSTIALREESAETSEQPSIGIDALAFSPDEQSFAAVDSVGDVHVWTLETQKLLHTLHIDGETSATGGAKFSLAYCDKDRLASSQPDRDGENGVLIWDLASGKLSAKLPVAECCDVRCLRAVKKKERLRLIVGSVGQLGLFGLDPSKRAAKSLEVWGNDDIIRLRVGEGGIQRGYNKGLFPTLGEVSEFGEDVNDLAIAPDGSRFVAVSNGSEGGLAVMFSLTDGAIIWTRTFPGFPLSRVCALNNFGQIVVCSGGLLPVLVSADDPSNITITPDEQAGIALTLDGETGEVVDKWNTGHALVVAFSETAANGVFASLGWDGKVRLWKGQGHQHLTEINTDQKTVTHIALSASGEHLLVGTFDGNVLLYQIAVKN